MTTTKQVDSTKATNPPPDLFNLPTDFHSQVKFAAPVDDDMGMLASLRASSGPWKDRGETPAESLEALTKLRPFVQVAKVATNMIGYVTIERDGPVPGAAYMRNIVVKAELRKKGVGHVLLNRALEVAREMNRKTLALRVDPANGPAVNFYRKEAFTTVATVVSKKSGKLRLL